LTEVGGKKTTAVFVFVTVLLDTLGLGLIIPVGPQLVASFVHDDLGVASKAFGLLVSLYSVMQFVFAPIVGGLSDRFGRRRVILTSLAGAAFSYLASGLAPALWWLFVGRVVAGATGASFSAANAYVADVTPPEKRAQAFGLVGAAFGLGFIIGPAVGGAVGDLGLRLPYLLAAGLNLVNFLYGLFVLPESLRPENRRPFDWRRANPLGSLRNLARHPIVLGLTGTLTCAYMSQWILQSVWALSCQARFGWSPRVIGMSLMAVGFGAAIVQGGLIRAILPRLGERRTLIMALSLGALGHLGFALAGAGWEMFALIFPFALAGLTMPAAQALITREVGVSEQGELQGSLNSLAGLVAIVGPLLGTYLFARFAPEGASPRFPGAPFLAAACFGALGVALAVRLFVRMPSRRLAVAPGEPLT
jgi:DHA1 family tetracycline resistance protein-like MFS transporter